MAKKRPPRAATRKQPARKAPDFSDRLWGHLESRVTHLERLLEVMPVLVKCPQCNGKGDVQHGWWEEWHRKVSEADTETLKYLMSEQPDVDEFVACSECNGIGVKPGILKPLFKK